MTTLLHVAVSPRAEASHSRRAAQLVLDRLRAASPGLRVIERDLAAAPLPHPDAPFVEASLMPDANRTGTHRATLALSEALIAELEAADAVLISTPVHNFTAPSVLKAWIDMVVRPERTFGRTPSGKVGMLPDRAVLVVAASGTCSPPSASTMSTGCGCRTWGVGRSRSPTRSKRSGVNSPIGCC
jgi:FMN-dependent NADH-azoreductase